MRKNEEKNDYLIFSQRCIKCGGVMRIKQKQEKKEDGTITRPKKYKCIQCGHEGKFGEQLEAPKISSSLAVSNNELATTPVFDDNNNPCLVVNGKRYPFTLGRIKLLEAEIAQKMNQLDNLKKAYEKELK